MLPEHALYQNKVILLVPVVLTGAGWFGLVGIRGLDYVSIDCVCTDYVVLLHGRLLFVCVVSLWLRWCSYFHTSTLPHFHTSTLPEKAMLAHFSSLRIISYFRNVKE